MLCPFCKRIIPTDSIFCSYCGERIVGTSNQNVRSEECAYCNGLGKTSEFIFESTCQVCGGTGSVLVIQPSHVVK
jgi:DnaJ-class molecular chaperone